MFVFQATGQNRVYLNFSDDNLYAECVEKNVEFADIEQVGHFATIQDCLTGLHRAGSLLSMSQTAIERLLEKNIAPMCLLDNNARLLFANTAFRKLLVISKSGI